MFRAPPATAEVGVTGAAAGLNKGAPAAGHPATSPEGPPGAGGAAPSSPAGPAVGTARVPTHVRRHRALDVCAGSVLPPGPLRPGRVVAHDEVPEVPRGDPAPVVGPERTEPADPSRERV